MLPQIGQKIADLVRQEIHNQITAVANHQARISQRMRFFPQILTADAEIPTGQQLVLDCLEIAAGTTLTVAGHLRVLSGIRNLGHLKITSTGSLRNG